MDVVARTGRTSALRRARAWHEQERGAERRDAAAPGVRVAGSRARRPGSSSPRAAPSSHLTANWETEENRLETLGEEREETSHGRTRHHGPREKCGLNTAELLSASAGPGTRVVLRHFIFAAGEFQCFAFLSTLRATANEPTYW
ncbi:hypothetical protein AGIG_G9476 [Arapaima gigas]